MVKQSSYEIRPIAANEWIPDRCLSAKAPFDPKTAIPEAGCASLRGFYTKENRDRLVRLYQSVLKNVGCCGFVAWQDECVVGYNNFFPREIAQMIRFYGWGNDEDATPGTLVHHCISLTNNPDYRHRGIGTSLITHSLNWAMENGWHRFEVHNVLPDNSLGYEQEQKSCAGFWQRLGFETFRSEPADSETRRIYQVTLRYSMALDLEHWQTSTEF